MIRLAAGSTRMTSVDAETRTLTVGHAVVLDDLEDLGQTG